MKLKDYLDKNGISRRQFAADIGVHQDAVFRWQRGAIPRKEILTKIVEVTDGKVRPVDFIEVRQAS